MRIVYLGTPQESAMLLEKIVKEGFSVEAVITRPDKLKGRGLRVIPSPVKLTALKHHIPLYQPQRLTSTSIAPVVEKHRPDVGLVFAFGRILPEAVLRMLPLGFINVHLSLLPRWRGAAPVIWTILSGDREAGVTVQKVAPELDTGNILAAKRIRLSGSETAGELTTKLTSLAVEVVSDVLSDYRSGRVPNGLLQDENSATYAPKITREDARIDWHRKAEEIERAVRAFNPRPYAHTRFIDAGRSLSVRIMKVNTTLLTEIPPGALLPSKRSTIVGTGDYALEVVELQPENRRRMSGREFAAGYLHRSGDARFE